MIVCGKPEFYPDRDDTITNPILIIEVLSESTKNYDRIEKIEFYRSVPTFQEYVLVDQYRVHIDHYYFESQGKWIYIEYTDMKDVLKLNKIAAQVSLQDIYKGVEFRAEKKSDSLRPSIDRATK